MIKAILNLAFRMNFPGVGHLSRFLYRNDLAPYITTQLIKSPKIDASKVGEFRADFRQHTDQIILRTGVYEPKVSAALFASLQQKDVFWDIGANTGYHSIFVKVNKPDIYVVGFEPNPEVFFRLIQNQKINSLDCVFLPIALGAEVSVQRLHIVSNGNSGLTTLKPNNLFLYDTFLDVLIFPGDFIVNNSLAPLPNVIKIDVEGSELDVLEGLTQILESGKLHTIIFEALDENSLDEIEKYLRKYHFLTPIPVDEHRNFISRLNKT